MVPSWARAARAQLGLSALSDQCDALVKHVHRNLRLIFGDDEWGSDADRAWPTTEEQNAAFEGELNDAVALFGGVLFGDFVLNDLNADHQTTPSDIAHQPVLAWLIRHALQHVIPDRNGVLQQVLLFNHVESRQGRGNADGITTKC